MKEIKEIKCKCGGEFKRDLTLFEDFIVDCIKCDKCGEVGFTLEQTKKIIKLREANKEIQGKRKLVKVGTSIASLLPKSIKKYGIKEGMVSNIRLLNSKALEIEFKKKIV